MRLAESVLSKRLALEAPSMFNSNAREIANIYWLVFLLTGRREASIDITADVVSSTKHSNPLLPAWLGTWSRRGAITKAIGAIRGELRESAQRTELARMDREMTLPRDWPLARETTKAQIEKALLSMDVFPRAALLLVIFEGAPITDAATLLEADTSLVRKAQAVGLRELMTYLAGRKDDAISGPSPSLAFAEAN
jgi:DNA-directed RNA polymerase specialized sigma24 family protein